MRLVAPRPRELMLSSHLNTLQVLRGTTSCLLVMPMLPPAITSSRFSPPGTLPEASSPLSLTSATTTEPEAVALASAPAAPDTKTADTVANLATSANPKIASLASLGLTAGLNIPHHVAIIMDGNGRWAQRRGFIRLMGHRQGAKAVTRTVEAAAELGVGVLTLFAFSSENWRRPDDEVSGLMELFAKVLKKERERLHKNNIKVSFIGDTSRFSAKLRKAISLYDELHYEQVAMRLNIAINYGGRWDITQAARTLAKQVKAGTLEPEDITEERMREALSTPYDVDLLIRTGGEYRISNFLLYQCAYSEMVVTDTLWPDFGQEDLLKAFASFNKRERRFGRTSAQVQSGSTT